MGTNVLLECVQMLTHSDDVILPEAKLIVIMPFKVQQSFPPSPSVLGHHEKVLVIPLVALHGVVRSQLLEAQGSVTGGGLTCRPCLRFGVCVCV